MQQGKLDEAQASLEEALRIRPNYAAAQLTLGNVFRRQKKCDKAVTQYEAAIKTQPNDPFAHGNLGFCYSMLGKSPDAIRVLRRATEPRPPTRCSGGCRWERCTAKANSTTRLLPSSTRRLSWIPITLTSCATSPLRYARPSSLIARPKSPSKRFGSSRAIAICTSTRGDHRVQQKTQEAIAAYRDAVRLNDKNADAWYDLGCCSLRTSSARKRSRRSTITSIRR